jgi:hypothetical protein
MGARELRTLVEGGHYFEGPRWHESRWWVSDFYRYGVFTVVICAAPDFAEESRKAARKAFLFTTTVEVPAR